MLKRIQVADDKNLQLIQDNVDAAITPMQAIPFVGGTVISAKALVTGQDNLVAHKLGHPVNVWSVIRQSANSVVWEQSSTQLGNESTDKNFINLRCSANCTVSLWFN